MEFAAFISAVVALPLKAASVVKYLSARDLRAAVTQLVVWGASIGLAFLLRASDFGDAIRIGAAPLSHLNDASLVLVGFAFGSTASVVYDFKKARDNSDSAAEPSLGQMAGGGDH